MTKEGIKMENRYALTIGEAAKSLGVSMPTMRKIASQKDFPAFRVGKRWIIPCHAFDEWLDKQARGRAAMPGREARSND